MKSSVYWKRLIGITIASAILIAPFRFLVVNAVVGTPTMSDEMEQTTLGDATDGVYDGVLMKMSDLSYADLDAYVHDPLSQLEQLATHDEGPPGIYKQIENVDSIDWHMSYASANRFFFSDLTSWRIIATQDDATTNGFYGVAYQLGHKIVIAYRGTDNVQDLLSDAGIYLSIPDFIDQLKPAQQFADRIRSSLPPGHYQVIFTGHSMGGWLAQTMYLTDLGKYPDWDIVGATVFNSIGTNFHPELTGLTSVKDYHFQGDIFSHYGSSLGQEIEIPNPTPDESIYDKHQLFDFYGYFYPVKSIPSTLR